MDWPNVIAAAIAFVGVPFGVFLAKFVRRRQRSEQFASAIFAKRLEAYEILLGLIKGGSNIVEQVLGDANLSAADRHALISEAIMPIAEHGDGCDLYIGETLRVHCTALFMGVEDIPDLPDPEKQARLAAYRSQLRETRRMIFEDSGVAKANKIFRSINRPRLTSPAIDYFEKLRRDTAKSVRPQSPPIRPRLPPAPRVPRPS